MSAKTVTTHRTRCRLTRSRRGIILSFFDCPDANRLSAAGLEAVSSLMARVFDDAENVRHLSRRCKLSAGWNAHSLGISPFPKSYTPTDLEAVEQGLLGVLDDPLNVEPDDNVQAMMRFGAARRMRD